MPSFQSGAAVLADARLRAEAFSVAEGLLIVEGHDDRRLFAPYCRRLAQILPAGGKPLLIDAYRRAIQSDRDRMTFVVDRDYDAGVSRLIPSLALIETVNRDVECDLLQLGALDRVVADLVPGVLDSDDRLRCTVEDVLQQAIALAEPIGRFRQLSNAESLGLRFEELELKRFRKRGRQASAEKIATAVVQRSSNAGIGAKELAASASATAGGLQICSGHDLLQAVQCVLHQDYGVEYRQLESLPTMLRLALAPAAFESWNVVVRLREWEINTRRSILR